MASPFLTLSPGDFSQLTILPSVMVEERAGINTSFTAFCVWIVALVRRGALGLVKDAPADGLLIRLLICDIVLGLVI